VTISDVIDDVISYLCGVDPLSIIKKEQLPEKKHFAWPHSDRNSTFSHDESSPFWKQSRSIIIVVSLKYRLS